MGDIKRELEWKNHSPFYVNLNDDLKHIKIISRDRDMAKQREYFKLLDDFKTHYSVYVKTKEITEKLTKCRKILYSREYATKEWSGDFHNQVITIMDLLREIHEDLIQGLYDNGLIPRFDEVDTKTPAAAKQKR